MEQKKIDRINELAKLAKERELTDEEKVERAALRQEYVNSVLGDLRNQLAAQLLPFRRPESAGGDQRRGIPEKLPAAGGAGGHARTRDPRRRHPA